jgi:hypothetical protein
VEYSHGQKAEYEAQMEGDGVFPPIFGYAPFYMGDSAKKKNV